MCNSNHSPMLPTIMIRPIKTRACFIDNQPLIMGSPKFITMANAIIIKPKLRLARIACPELMIKNIFMRYAQRIPILAQAHAITH